MRSWARLSIGLALGITSCAQLLDADAPYELVDEGISTGSDGAGGAGSSSNVGGGFIETPCSTEQDCPPTGMDCLQSTCTNAKCGVATIASGMPCAGEKAGFCNDMGACVECTLPEHCSNIVEDECTKRACASNACVPIYAGEDTLANSLLQTPADCQKIVCNGNGGTKTAPEDTDLPNDNNGCTMDTCTGGMAMFINLPAGTMCGNDFVCNTSGQCVGCVEAADCPGTDDFCKQRTCTNQACGFMYAAENTPLPAMDQASKDCKVLVCDGQGNIVLRTDTNDRPIDDNLCTQDTCSAGGVPSNEPEPKHTLCGIGQACDGEGACKISNGSACSTIAECASGFCTDGVCCDSSCNTTCRSCNLPGSAGTCLNVPIGTDDVSTVGSCGGVTHACDGLGVCKLENGQACTSPSQCLSNKCSGNPKSCQP